MGWKYGFLFLQDGRNTQATETNAEVEFYLHLINFLVWDWAKFRFDYLTTLPCNTGNLEQMHNPHTDSGFNLWCCICLREDSGDLSAIGETLRWEEQALKSNSINTHHNYLKGSPCVFGRAELASAICSGCWDYVTSLLKKNRGNVDCWLHSHCCLFPHQFWTGSKVCSSGSSATSRLYCWYFVTLARLWLPCYYPYKKQNSCQQFLGPWFDTFQNI